MDVYVITGGVSGTWINVEVRDDPSSPHGFLILKTKSSSWRDHAPSVEEMQLSSSGGNGGSSPPVVFMSTGEIAEPEPRKAAVAADEDEEESNGTPVALTTILHGAPAWVNALTQQVVVQPAREFMVYHSRCVCRRPLPLPPPVPLSPFLLLRLLLLLLLQGRPLKTKPT
jgi:hypothetical protein